MLLFFYVEYKHMYNQHETVRVTHQFEISRVFL